MRVTTENRRRWKIGVQAGKKKLYIVEVDDERVYGVTFIVEADG